MTFSIEVVILIIIQVVGIVGVYWKLRMEVRERPTFTKVESMIKRDMLTEENVYKIIDRDAFSKAEGLLLSQRLNTIEQEITKSYKLLEKIERQLQEHIVKG